MQAIIALLVVCLAAASYAVPTGRIVGGTDAPEGLYPYQVSLKQSGSLFCGGSILNKRYILTAAHCVVGKYPQYVEVHAGTVYLNKQGDVYPAEKLIAHPNFSSSKLINDVALIRVSKDIEFNEFVQPIQLASNNNVKAGDVAILTGWGRLGRFDQIPNHLQQINLRIESQQNCAAKHWRVTDSHICTFTRYGEGACNGDSGGPLVANGVQVGIVSFGTPCAVGSPDVYTRVYYFLDWIKENQE
ncbi:hypothetical protein KPH14_006295 [Odynerus spinipes]|uniref:Chymotrypsin-2 n=1 Tax=Odynerus spinipes TaxID=1348599 RepID=A0AAD9RT16_9HYME|nr:hypothetical protein KPH14_006295 [Odynerus spinipes]